MSLRPSIVRALTALTASIALAPATPALAAVTITVRPRSDCTIYAGDPPSTSDCGGASADTVGRDGDGFAYRTLLAFPRRLGLPPGARVLSAKLELSVLGSVGKTKVGVYALRRAFQAGHTSWESYDGVHAWSRAGGDFFARPLARFAVSGSPSAPGPGPGPGPGTTVVGLTAAVRGWLAGRYPIPAVVLLPTSSAPSAFTFTPGRGRGRPVLTVTYDGPRRSHRSG